MTTPLGVPTGLSGVSAPAETGTGAPTTPATAPVQPTPSATPQPGTPPVSGTPPTDPRPEGHVLRSALAQQEQTLRAKWEAETAHLRQLETILKENGRDPQQIIQDYEAAKQQYNQQVQAQQMGLGQVDPNLARTLMQMQGTIQQMQQAEARRIGMQKLQEAESNNAELAKKIGINYEDIREDVRKMALQNETTVDVAFKALYFDRFLQGAQQQGTAEALLALQGRGQTSQPASSAVPGGPQTGPVDYMKMSREDFLAAQARFRQGY